MLYKDIIFGPDDAKGDTKLADYFVKIPEYEKVRDGDVSFVIGRKGTGKTAICQMIYEEALNTSNVFAVLLSFKNCPSADLYASQDKNFRAPNEYISIWKFLIALESAKLLIEDESIDSEIREYLKVFIYSNFGNVDVACLDVVSTLKEKDWKVGISLPDVCGYKLPSGEIAGNRKTSGNQKIHYGKAASTLITKIKEIRTSNVFNILFDELDEDYQVDKQYFHLLISLFKAAYQFKQEISAGGPDICGGPGMLDSFSVQLSSESVILFLLCAVQPGATEGARRATGVAPGWRLLKPPDLPAL